MSRANGTARTGHLEDGLDADIVVVSENPQQDMKALREIELVIKRSQILFDVLCDRKADRKQCLRAVFGIKKRAAVHKECIMHPAEFRISPCETRCDHA